MPYSQRQSSDICRELLESFEIGTVVGMTESGTERPAGEGISDEEMVRQVAGQTASDLKHQDFFEREADGASSDTEAAKADADEVAE